MNTYLPPVAFDVRVHEKDARSFRIWFPFFLLWPLLLLIVAFVLLVTLLVDLGLLIAGARYHHYSLLVLGTLRLLSEVRGTHVNALSGTSHINVDIY